MQCSLARVVTRSTTNSILLLLHHCTGFQYSSVLITNWHAYSCPLFTPQCPPSVSLIIASILHSTTKPLICFSESSLPASINVILASRGFRYADTSLWNSFPRLLQSVDSYSAFKTHVKIHLFFNDFSI